jgi:catalase (peroxidase I)
VSGFEKTRQLTLKEWINEFYINLLKEHWKLTEIDEMDIWYYLDLVNYQHEKEYWKNVDEALSVL